MFFSVLYSIPLKTLAFIHDKFEYRTVSATKLTRRKMGARYFHVIFQ